MTKNELWISGVAVPVLIAIMLFALSSRVTANAEPSAPAAAVKIDNFVFGPQTVTVPVGTTVTWTNVDDIPHTAVSTDGVFKSKVMDNRWRVQVQGDGYGRKVFLHLHQDWYVFVLLLGTSENDGQSRSAVTSDS
ncbi:MAG: plastocyanin/azurin family copper-binding protein [Candidatus Sulfotelmatobacter sp.]